MWSNALLTKCSLFPLTENGVPGFPSEMTPTGTSYLTNYLGVKMTVIIDPGLFTGFAKKEWKKVPKKLEEVEKFVSQLGCRCFTWYSYYEEFDRQRRELNLLKKLTEGFPEASTKLVKLPKGIYHIEMDIPESVLTGDNGTTLLKNLMSQLVIIQESLEDVRKDTERACSQLEDISRVINF